MSATLLLDLAVLYAMASLHAEDAGDRHEAARFAEASQRMQDRIAEQFAERVSALSQTQFH